MLTALSARPLGQAQVGQVASVLAADPVSCCLVASRFEQVGMDRTRLGGQFWGIAGGRDGLCFAGPNLVPLSGDAHAVRLFAQALGRRGRSCASILGPADLVLPLWERLEPRWGRARDVRPDQPLLVCGGAPRVEPDEGIRVVRPDQLEAYFPAAVAMFTEEVGVDPRIGDGGRWYKARVADLIAAGRALARFDGDRVVFKAEIGAMSSQVALIQGVWVAPELRGRGIAAPGAAAMVRQVQRVYGRLPSLYVNHDNAPARAAYARVGFEQVGTFASVQF